MAGSRKTKRFAGSDIGKNGGTITVGATENRAQMLQRPFQLQAEGGCRFPDRRRRETSGKLKVRDFAPEREFEGEELIRSRRTEAERPLQSTR